MINRSGFPIVAAIAAAIAVALLIFLFTVPGNYLRDMTAKLRVMTHEAEQAAVLGDMATAAECSGRCIIFLPSFCIFISSEV